MGTPASPSTGPDVEEGEILELPSNVRGEGDLDPKRDERKSKWSALMGDVYAKMDATSNRDGASSSAVGMTEEGEREEYIPRVRVRGIGGTSRDEGYSPGPSHSHSYSHFLHGTNPLIYPDSPPRLESDYLTLRPRPRPRDDRSRSRSYFNDTLTPPRARIRSTSPIGLPYDDEPADDITVDRDGRREIEAEERPTGRGDAEHVSRDDRDDRYRSDSRQRIREDSVGRVERKTRSKDYDYYKRHDRREGESSTRRRQHEREPERKSHREDSRDERGERSDSKVRSKPHGASIASSSSSDSDVSGEQKESSMRDREARGRAAKDKGNEREESDVKEKETEKDRDRGRAESKATKRRRSRSRSRTLSSDSESDSEASSRSGSGSGSGSDTSDSDSEQDKRRRRKRRARRREERENRRRRKERKKAKKRKEKAIAAGRWGIFGVIRDSDMASKKERAVHCKLRVHWIQEFRIWLVEERKINPVVISREKSKKEFRRYVDGYNTASLPHAKYYNMAKYEERMNLIRTGQSLPIERGYDALADMRAHSTGIRLHAGPKATKELTRAEVEELRRVQAERTEIGHRKVMGLEVPKNMGVRRE